MPVQGMVTAAPGNVWYCYQHRYKNKIAHVSIYLSFWSCDGCRRLPEPKHHSFLFNHWSASKCLVFMAARTSSIPCKYNGTFRRIGVTVVAIGKAKKLCLCIVAVNNVLYTKFFHGSTEILTSCYFAIYWKSLSTTRNGSCLHKRCKMCLSILRRVWTFSTGFVKSFHYE
jgi:hypothetical protein